MGVIREMINKATGNREVSTENPGVSSSSPDVSAAAPDDSAAAAVIAARKERSDKGKPRGTRGEKLTPGQAQMAAAFDEIYRPQTWEGIVCAPADTMLALSGRKLWEVSEKERTTLSTHAALTARFFAVENPKWLALTMLAISITHIYGARTVQHMHERRKEKEKEEAAEALKNPPKP